MDETGISNVHKPANIVATKGARAVGKMTSGEKAKTVTIICTTNAVGIHTTYVYFSKKAYGGVTNAQCSRWGSWPLH